MIALNVHVLWDTVDHDLERLGYVFGRDWTSEFKSPDGSTRTWSMAYTARPGREALEFYLALKYGEYVVRGEHASS